MDTWVSVLTRLDFVSSVAASSQRNYRLLRFRCHALQLLDQGHVSSVLRMFKPHQTPVIGMAWQVFNITSEAADALCRGFGHHEFLRAAGCESPVK